MFFRIEIAGTGHDYTESEARSFSIDAQRLAGYGARFFIDGRPQRNLAVALDIASLYL